MKILLALVVLVCLGCSSKSNIVSPVAGVKGQPVTSPYAQLTDCERVQQLYQQRIENLYNALTEIRAIEIKTVQDLHAEQILVEQLTKLQIEEDQAICEACPGAC